MRPLRPRRPALSLAALPALLAGALLIPSAGCEPRVEEPLPSPRPETPAGNTALAASANTPAQNPAKPARCIKPTPDKPTRTVPPGPNPACPPDDLATPPKLRT